MSSSSKHLVLTSETLRPGREIRGETISSRIGINSSCSGGCLECHFLFHSVLIRKRLLAISSVLALVSRAALAHLALLYKNIKEL